MADQDKHIYISIDLKSFYASVECMERGLDPLTTNLVVADETRTEKTICLAVSPSLKAYGIPGRARLFEVVQRVKEVNERRRLSAPGHKLCGSSYDARELEGSEDAALDYIVAMPRMTLYMEYSRNIYRIYLKYVAPEDIHVYSIDEVFMDVTDYLAAYRLTPSELTGKIIRDILDTTGITATAGIGTNLYLCKVAMDVEAKHVEPDERGIRIAYLDEITYRRRLWNHRPLTDFWRVGRGYAKKLEENGLYTMGDIARCSLGKADEFYNEELLYRLFGINAQLLIDHAWGYEPVTIADVKGYRPENNSLCSGQVLSCPYDTKKAALVVKEMADLMALDLVDKGLVTNQMILTIGYDISNLTDIKIKKMYQGPVTTDGYGRKKPKHAHGTANLARQTSSARLITEAVMELYDRIINPILLVRRITLTANHVVEESRTVQEERYEQMNLFTDYEALDQQRKKEEEELEREKRIQKTVLDIKKKYGKNAIVKGMNLEKGATAISRNQQIGGHKA